VRIAVDAPIRGCFVRRYKRFFVDVETDSGEELTVHCPNPGSMKGFLRPGSAVRCSTSDSPTRKLAHSLEMMRIGRVWVGLHTGRANAVAHAALAAGWPRRLAGYGEIAREVSIRDDAGAVRARLDFALSQHAGGERDVYVEVKSVTLAKDGIARFPDSVTERGRKHLDVLEALHRDGHRSALLFLVQRADCESVAPADDIDPRYGEALRRAAKAGVEVFALGARVTARAITVERELPVVL
jgi:sugar fermentation stimulation protein A